MANIKYYHIRGQQDAVDRNYDPPRGPRAAPPSGPDGKMKKHLLETRAYELGYFHDCGQQHQAERAYHPPPEDHFNEAYDKGWKAAKKAS